VRVKHVPFQPRLLWCQPKRKCYLHPGTPISQHPRSSVFARNQRHASVNTPLGGTRDDTITTGVCDFGNHHIVVVVVDRASARVPSSSLIHSVICARAVRETAHRRRQSRYQTKTPTRRADGRVGFARHGVRRNSPAHAPSRDVGRVAHYRIVCVGFYSTRCRIARDRARGVGGHASRRARASRETSASRVRRLTSACDWNDAENDENENENDVSSRRFSS
jgi:hypothetical protein